jgi:hypothetical protein
VSDRFLRACWALALDAAAPLVRALVPALLLYSLAAWWLRFPSH